jgi:hypothetical protein
MGTSMFDNESSEAKRPTDWSGTIIGLMLLPVFFVWKIRVGRFGSDGTFPLGALL